MAKKKDLTTYNEIFVAQKLAEEELNTNEINEPLERLDFLKALIAIRSF
ncbi:hypothetical protein UBN68_06000 [Helicobacter pylori]